MRSTKYAPLFGLLLVSALAACGEAAWSADPECFSIGCEFNAQCTFDGQRCIIGSDADCRHSRPCTEQGRCARDSDVAFCIVVSDADCARSDRCRDFGQCSYYLPAGAPEMAAHCLPQSDEDCRRSVLCTTGGFCAYSASTRTCVKG